MNPVQDENGWKLIKFWIWFLNFQLKDIIKNWIDELLSLAAAFIYVFSLMFYKVFLARKSLRRLGKTDFMSNPYYTVSKLFSKFSHKEQLKDDAFNQWGTEASKNGVEAANLSE